MKKSKNRVRQYEDKNPVEQFLSIGRGVMQSGNDLGKQFLDPESILGIKKNKENNRFSGDLMPGEELKLKELIKKQEQEEDNKPDIDPGIYYHREIREMGKVASQRLSRETENTIEQILLELKKIIATTLELQTQYNEFTVIQTVVNPGKYHESFFEWLLSIVKNARMKVEDSGAWLAATKGKHAKRGSYWRMADEKVGGTSFSLSSERIVATQVG